jgi:hypothetical protein
LHELGNRSGALAAVEESLKFEPRHAGALELREDLLRAP